MLASLLNRKRLATSKQKHQYNWKFLLVVPLWMVLCYFAAQFIMALLLGVLKASGIPVADLLSTTVLQTLFTALMYVVMLVLVIGGPWVAFQRRTNLETLGLSRLMSWADIGLAPLTFIVYGMALTFVMYVITSLIPGFPTEEAQDVGFKTITRQYEYMLAFIMLVVVAPIAEEAIFRGYLYGKLRKHVPIYAAALVTSLLFALAHGQWNVAIDTFVLGLFLVALREVTGSIWAGILLHMIKNAIAFFWIFVSPYMLI